MSDAMEYAAALWELENPEPVSLRPTKAVYSALSRRFGPVVLKINRDRGELKAEYEALSRLDGRCCCRVYAFDEDAGALLEECILPGTRLREEPVLEKRLQAFCRVFREIHIPGCRGQTYRNWLDSACRYCAGNPGAVALVELAAQARDICARMYEKYPERVLLHGDLHHDNLLRREDGSYAAIDPKGVIGPAILDLPRFLLNELDTVHDGGDLSHIGEAIRLLGERLGYPREDVAGLFFMETVLANVWSLEDGEIVDWERLELASRIMNGG